MAELSSQPDLSLTLDFSGVIQRARLTGKLADDDTNASPERSISTWVGKAWRDTCDATSASKVDRIISGAARDEVCGYSQINHQMPNGESILFECVAVQTLEQPQRIMVLGKNLSSVITLQNRLLSTQRSMETEFWKLRELETRYSTLVNANSDAVLVLREPDFKIIDTNEQALRTIGLSEGDNISSLAMSDRDTTKLTAMLTTAKASGRAPLTILNIGADNEKWRVKASSYRANSGIQYVLQFSIHNSMSRTTNVEPINGVTPGDIVAHLPDGFVAINRQNIITHVNAAFGALINRDDSANLLGQPISQWLQSSNDGLTDLRSQLAKEGVVCNFPGSLTVTDNANGQTAQDVFLSAKQIAGDNTDIMLMLVRPAAA